MFDAKKPTAMLMGRFQPWHEGHLRLFQKALRLTGQVCIVIRTMPLDENNPYDLNQVKQKLQVNLHENGYRFFEHYITADLPNIVDISYGRDVGYTFTEHDLGEEIHKISATDIRKQESLREFDSESVFMEFESDWARHYDNK